MWVFFLSWHLLYFRRWYSVSNQHQEQWCNVLLTETETGLLTYRVFSAFIAELELGFAGRLFTIGVTREALGERREWFILLSCLSPKVATTVQKERCCQG